MKLASKSLVSSSPPAAAASLPAARRSRAARSERDGAWAPNRRPALTPTEVPTTADGRIPRRSSSAIPIIDRGRPTRSAGCSSRSTSILTARASRPRAPEASGREGLSRQEPAVPPAPRGPLRLARHGRIQPRPRRPPRQRGEEVPASLGVAADKIETLSKGSEEAKKNADEATMAKDRRDELVVLKK
jgi:hypothetical protein